MKTYLRHVMPITLAVLAACTGNKLEVGNVEKDGGIGDPASSDGGQVACPFASSPKPIALGTVLGLGTSPKTGTIYLVDQVDNLQRVFVSGYSSATPEEPVILKRQRISGSGSGPDFMVFTTSGPDAIFTLQIDTPGGGAMRMGVVQGVLTDKKTIIIGQDGEELQVMVNPVPKISLRNLPGDVTTEYVASTDEGNFMLVTRPTDDWSYSDFRLFFGPATAMAERSVSTVNRAKDGGSTTIIFTLDGSTATASFPVVSVDGKPGPAILTIGAQVSPLTRLSAPPADAKYVCGVSLHQCRWPAAVEPKDAGADEQCRAGRVLVTCELADGSQSVGLRDDPRGCSSLCNDNEYGAACGTVGPAHIPEPPEGCRMALAIPAGIITYCCPCL